LTVEGIGQKQVFVPIPGRLESIEVEPGERVNAGDVLARLANPELDSQIAYLEHRLRSVAIAAEKFFALQRPGEEQSLQVQHETIEKELETLREQHERLVIRAEQAGMIVPAARVEDRQSEMQGIQTLQGWSTDPLRTSNLGSRLEENTILCEIRPDQEFEAVVLVEQTEIAFLKPGQNVEIKLDTLPDRVLRGKLQEIARIEVEIPPDQLLITKGGELPVRLRPDGRYGVPTPHYEVRVALEGFEEGDGNPHEMLSSGLRGRAKISCGHWTCWDVAVREFHKLFRM
jgi:putative peptide zinc metalloprotease protein